ncbi:MAG TPA: Xaa-Pro peptidase family protein [Methylomirabilota bacterium]|nr:Xaa-Pro peptidase family protein [Methylomirabilota bacterium]
MSREFSRSVWKVFRIVAATLSLAIVAGAVQAQQRREREPNSAYAARRTKLAAQADAPIILLGLTGREESSQTYLFAQEDNFYYLTGHNQEGAALVILPSGQAGAAWDGPKEILFLPPRNPRMEKWVGVRMGADDPGIQERTGFATVRTNGPDHPELRATVEKLAKLYPEFYTILPYRKENGGYPHEKEVVDWFGQAAPNVKLKDIRAGIGAMRQVKSPGELAFLERAIDLSVESHVDAMRRMRPGLFEYQIAARMVEIHAMGGSESEGYAPIVGAGIHSTELHYDSLGRKIEDGDIVVIDVGAEYAGYSADVTRTVPANGKFTPRQREIYEIVLGAQNAAIAAVKPGAGFCPANGGQLTKIARDYIDTHGKDLHGDSLGKYFIHGLGHHIGLDVHDAGDPCRLLEPGMVVTIEPGIYIPEENLGVRIEDDVLVTETGYKILSVRAPRDPAEIEKIMSQAAKQRAQAGSSDSRGSASPD